MRAFAALLDRLVLTPQRNTKLRLMVNYFETTPDPDRGWALAALTGELDLPGVKPAMLRALVAERIDEILFHYSYDYVGDLAETIALVWPPAGKVEADTEPRLGAVVEELRMASRLQGPRIVERLLDSLQATERWALIKLVTGELILTTARTLAHDLRTRFGIAAPKIGVAGLNPHAGEAGGIGQEELEVIAPAVAELKFEGLDVDGPFPGDTLFYPPLWRRFDAIIAMYHDQALIPIKTVAFDSAVNTTLGLPIVRTSPDHGTAFDLAGTGKASVTSFLAALRLADRLTAEHG